MNRRILPLLSFFVVSGATASAHARAPFDAPELPLAAHDGPDGHVRAHHNDVRARPDAEAQWTKATPGTAIFKQGRVNTREESMALVEMRDQGWVTLRQNTLLIIYGHHALRNKRIIAMDAELERGALRSRLGELAGGGKAKVATPSSTTELDGGNTLFKVDDQGTSRVANHGDGKTTVRGKKKPAKVDVKKGWGTKVEKGGKPAAPIPLPATPQWQSGPRRFLAVGGTASEIRGSWKPVDKAHSYYVEVARDADGGDVISAVTVPASVTKFEIHGLPLGAYWVRVAAVDDDQFESIPSAAIEVGLVGATLIGPAGTSATWQEIDGRQVARVLPGTKLEPADGVTCSSSNDEAGAAASFVTPGIDALTCIDANGDEVAGFAVDVVGVEVPTAQSERLVFEAGARTSHEVRLASDIPLPDSTQLVLPAGVTLVSLTRTAGDRWQLVVDSSADVAKEGMLAVRLEQSETAPTVTEIPFRSEHPDAPPAPPEKKERHMAELGLSGGLAWLSEDHGLFAPEVGQRPLERPAAAIGLSLGYFPIRWVGLELAAKIEPARVTTPSASALVWATRIQAVGQLPFRVTPFLHVGIGIMGVRSETAALGDDTDFGFHYGGGLKAYLTRRVALRTGITAIAAESVGSGSTQHVELDLGITLVLGRQSAGRKPRSTP